MRRSFFSLACGAFLLIVCLVCAGTNASADTANQSSTSPSGDPLRAETCNPLTNYEVQRASGVLNLPGELVAGSQCDLCRVPVALPFTVRLYDRTFTSAIATDNGTLQFASDENMEHNFCLLSFMYHYAIHGYWNDLDMRPTTCPQCGIYTSLTGLSPNRVFNVQWRACTYAMGDCGGDVRFEVRFYEGRDRFDVVYGSVVDGGMSATVGVEREVELDTPYKGQGLYTQVSCLQGNLHDLLALQFWQPTCDPTPPRCPGERFTDVCRGDYFFEPVLGLNEAGVVSGYNSSPPCENAEHVPCFRPYAQITRGQASKVVALAAGLEGEVSGQTFEDVPPGSTFYSHIMQLANRGVMGGYDCGTTPEEPCGAERRPYFRPGAHVSRGQLSKIISNTANFTEVHSSQSFQDVPPNSPFHAWIERLARRSIIGGYTCGGAGEPCVGNRLPYFRPGADITRGQTAKIVYLVWPQEQGKD